MNTEEHAPPAPEFTEPTVVFLINRSWQEDFGAAEIYEATRGNWLISKKSRDAVRVALGVAHDVVRGAYFVDHWEPAEEELGRWAFTGREHESLAHFIGTSVRDQLGKNHSAFRLFLNPHS